MVIIRVKKHYIQWANRAHLIERKLFILILSILGLTIANRLLMIDEDICLAGGCSEIQVETVTV